MSPQPTASAKPFNVQTVATMLWTMSGSLIVIGVLVGIFSTHAHRHSSGSQTVLAAVVIAFFGMGLRLAAQQMERPLDGRSRAALITSYQRRFFLWVGIGEAPAFAGIVAVVLTGRWYLFLVGVAFAYLTFAQIAPTTTHLDCDQRQIAESGSELSIHDVLVAPGSAPAADA